MEWSPAELARMWSRALLQAPPEGAWLPTCEIDMRWRVVQVEPAVGFDSLVTVTNNREVRAAARA